MTYVFSRFKNNDTTRFAGYVDPVSTVTNKRKIVYSINDHIMDTDDANITEYFGIKQSETYYAWFNVTEDGTKDGTPLFDFLDECFFTPSVVSNIDEGMEVPMVHVRSFDNNSVLVHIQRSNSGRVEKGKYYDGTVYNDQLVTVQLRVVGIRS